MVSTFCWAKPIFDISPQSRFIRGVGLTPGGGKSSEIVDKSALGLNIKNHLGTIKSTNHANLHAKISSR